MMGFYMQLLANLDFIANSGDFVMVNFLNTLDTLVIALISILRMLLVRKWCHHLDKAIALNGGCVSICQIYLCLISRQGRLLALTRIACLVLHRCNLIRYCGLFFRLGCSSRVLVRLVSVTVLRQLELYHSQFLSLINTA